MPSSYYFIYNPRSWNYQKNCLLQPIPSSAMGAAILTALDIFQGTPAQAALQPRAVVQYFGFLFVYNAAQCPMEAIHGRPSLWHNIISAGTIGYIGVRTGRFGVPFVNPMMLQYQYGIRPEVVAFGIYGGIAGILAGALGGKSF
ncbi:hypothetical protein IV203_015003 [Nitzschia inconspicua]|uniref:Uncharacterized protein n=1 Tax=Nitzschia inconspicua TaxID=303405 RepID=A0A9K3L9Y0_9STRA|nr:hypothetical protein IV203_015003 [Nitzschia inconspicua]